MSKGGLLWDRDDILRSACVWKPPDDEAGNEPVVRGGGRIDTDIPILSPEFTQAYAFAQLARTTRRYFLALVREGFTEEQALSLTDVFEGTILAEGIRSAGS